MATEPEKQLAHYSLLDGLLARRSRRFGKGQAMLLRRAGAISS